MFGTIIAIALLAAIGYVALHVSKQPNDFRYEKSAAMNATPAAIHAVVNDLRQWNNWSPWAKLDPNCKNTIEGSGIGVGSKFSWDGDKKVGAGEMTVLESRSDELVRMRLEFFRPFKGVNTVDFAFKPQDDQTLVTWAMYGPNTLPGKIMSLFINCEKMMDKSFAEGLANLKSIVEANPPRMAKAASL